MWKGASESGGKVKVEGSWEECEEGKWRCGRDTGVRSVLGGMEGIEQGLLILLSVGLWVFVTPMTPKYALPTHPPPLPTHPLPTHHIAAESAIVGKS